MGRKKKKGKRGEAEGEEVEENRDKDAGEEEGRSGRMEEEARRKDLR